MFGPSFSNLAEHHLRVMWLSIIIAKMENKGDMEKILKMALVHDVGESRAGDVHYISRQYTKRDELKAINDIFKDTSLSTEMVKLWQEYDKKLSIEAKIVKDADFLDVDLELQEQLGKGENHLGPWKKMRKLVFPKFYTSSAKKLWKEIRKSNPAEWYLTAPSRFNGGDMSPKKN